MGSTTGMSDNADPTGTTDLTGTTGATGASDEAAQPEATGAAPAGSAAGSAAGEGAGEGTGAGTVAGAAEAWRARAQRGAASAGTRTPRLIQTGSTTEIPLHLLFRDESGRAAPVQLPPHLPPTVVGRRLGTGEQPRAGARRPVLGPSPARAAVPTRVAVPAEVSEWRGRSWSGAAAVAAGATGLAGCAAGCWWAGLLPTYAVQLARLPEQLGAGLGPAQWAVLAGSGALSLFAFGGLGRGRVGRAWVLSLFGRYRGSVRRNGLVWINPLLKRRRVDVRLRHWRSEPMPGVDAHGVALRVVLLVVWRIKDTARAALGVDDHVTYLRECVEAALAGVLSQLPVDAPLGGTGGATLRNAESVGDALTRRVAVDAEAAGIEVFAVRPTRIDYAPEVAESERRRRLAALEARDRDTALTQLVDSVEDTVTRLTVRGLVELDDCERKALVKDLTVAFCTGQTER
ncbi:SPFH domain-containing protein [Streptomyces cavernicola]|uniref:SPFH domain-containing protein n=1 Tax=Streptomyces cavernicola TaxID=3043613 RepID=A0ABT6S8F0_9ACTN|nr:SPFH domain-containing protein [Streptomyces sp. B-S-A6]MDI3404382.1 SPFH domain-containing protein [Streptomyces sp. B-S-A6]